MCINTHCTPIKFSKYYPTTNGKAGGQTTKKLKSLKMKLTGRYGGVSRNKFILLYCLAKYCELGEFAEKTNMVV